MFDFGKMLDDSEDSARRRYFGDDDDGSGILPFHLNQREQFHFAGVMLVGIALAIWVFYDWVQWFGNNAPFPS